mmetsp:Transcript_36792/g.84740  ORF Transcript_36792/g.84740 Transcript_36792/m.84740 type:complete len:253 (-) Transcript_36792:161-919(-)
MDRVGLIFELGYAETQPGEKVCVVGNHPALGNWQLGAKEVRDNQELRTGPGIYPQWANLNTVWLTFDRGLPHPAEALEQQLAVSPLSYSLDDLDFAPTPESPASPDCADFGEENPQCDREMICVEYKFVKDRSGVADRGPRLQWEDRIPNRRVLIPRQQGTIWVVRDCKFNDGHQEAVARASLPEVAKRLFALHELDPEWTTRREVDELDAPEWCQVAKARSGEKEECPSPRSGNTRMSGHTTSTRVWPFAI